MKRIKLLTLILMAALALSLCSCSLLDSFRGTAAAELPDVSTPKTELTEAEAVALYDGIMSCSADGDSVPDYQSVAETVVAAKAFSTPATVAAYLDYVALCEASGFENGGSMSVTDGSCVTAFFTGNEEEVILVIHRNDTMYVIYLELDLPESEPPVWPTDEEFARYGASLTQAE